jgi:hypothetical protein
MAGLAMNFLETLALVVVVAGAMIFLIAGVSLLVYMFVEVFRDLLAGDDK